MLAMMLLAPRETDLPKGPLANPAYHAQSPPMLPGDADNHGQSQAISLRLISSVERLPTSSPRFFVHSFAGISNANDDMTRLIARPITQQTTLRHRFQGVLDQHSNSSLDLSFVANNMRL